MSIYAVNGKIPVAAWIPSRDTAGNGTTTLNDLVGTNHGTLTNMDAATDWVADTGAGGVRALDFDGTNDRVAVSSNSALNVTSALALSTWFYPTRSPTNNEGIAGKYSSYGSFINQRQYVLGFNIGSVLNLAFSSNGTFEAGNTLSFASAISLNTWNHAVAVFIPSTRIELWLNGSVVASSTASIPSALHSGTGPFSIGNQFDTASSLLHFQGLVDDTRLFNASFDSLDVSYLYNSGNGRGRIASNNQTFQLGMPI